MSRIFRDLLKNQFDQKKFVCVGLDTLYEKLPESISRGAFKDLSGPDNAIDLMKAQLALEFNKAIVDATRDLVCAYKPNAAFYETLGREGVWVLRETAKYIHEVAPEVVVIEDGKRGDIGDTNVPYAQGAFDRREADAVTVHPFLGYESLAPFLSRADKGIFVLCRTSNPGAGEFQDLELKSGEKLYERVAERVGKFWNTNNNCGLVTGATYPEEISRIRQIVGDDIPFLIPGVGKQGGSLEAAVMAGMDSRGKGFIINSSRDVIYASSGEDFKEAARAKVMAMNDTIAKLRGSM